METTRRSALAGLAATAATATTAFGTTAARAAPREALLFSYFTGGEGQSAGLRLATSADGLRFAPLAGGRPLLVPQVGEKKLMRDPFLLRGPGRDGLWHLLWTTAWEGVTLGHATSRNLVDWSPQRAIPVMAGVEGTRNVWAPEMMWDSRRGHYMLFWSSTVTGRFPETAGASEDAYNHRLWYTTTRDFQRFAPAQVLWDPGFSVIDASFLDHPRLGLHLIVKDETVNPPRKHLRIARAASPAGPFTALSAPFSPDWVEGPTAIVLGEWTYVYYDRYRDKAWGAARSRDLKTWEDVSDRLQMVPGARHGTIVKAPLSLIEGVR